MKKLNSAHVLRATILLVCLSILLPGLLWAAGGDGEADFCPGTPERELHGACLPGHLQMNGCSNVGATGCGEVCLNSNSCWAIPECGGLSQRACCSGAECDAGLTQIFEDPDDIGLCDDFAGGCLCEAPNQNTAVTSSGYCQTITPCGGDGERACHIADPHRYEIGGACEATLQEITGCEFDDCQPLNSSSCFAVPPCGGAGQRACCAGEKSPVSGQPLNSCAVGLEQVSADPDDLGICDGSTAGACICYTGGLSTFAVTSNTTCFAPTACGGPGQRACCSGEPGRPTTADFACPNGGAVALREVAATPDPALFCGQDADVPGALTNSVCEAVEPCGGVGQRACCTLSNERLPLGGCQADLVEAPGCDGTDSSCLCGGTDQIISSYNYESLGTCVQASSCGGIGERGCCIGPERLPTTTGACEEGLTEVPNGCTGNCYCGSNEFGTGALSSSTCISLAPQDFPIAEPSTNCTPGSPGCPLSGYADMHVHMFGHLAHGGAAFVGQPYNPEGGVNEALRQDAWTTAEIELGGIPRALVDKNGDSVPALDEGACIAMNELSLGGLTWNGTQCVDTEGNRAVKWHGAHLILYDTIGAGTFDMAGSVDASNIDLPLGPLGFNAPFGAPAFNAWPTWTTTVHQQVYYKWLERAYLGGMRLMVMMAVNSEAACRTGNHLDDIDAADRDRPAEDCKMSMLPPDRLYELDYYDNRFKVCDGTTCAAPPATALPLPLLPPIELQLQAAYEFEDWLNLQPGGDWFKIARTPEEARQAIADGKLAVVLSIEVDHLFNCHTTNSGPDFPNGDPRPECTEEDVLRGIDKYYEKGVRHVFPVHNFDNAFAGPATWINSLNVANRAMSGEWWDVKECPPGTASLNPPGDDGYGLKVSLGIVENLMAMIGFPQLTFLCEGVLDYYLACSLDPDQTCDNPPADPPGCTSLLLEAQPIYENNGQNASCNEKGLSPGRYDPVTDSQIAGGAFLIDALMDKGMLIDIDHMSIKSLDSTILLAEENGGYPLLASHGQFFELQEKYYDGVGSGRHERLRTREQLVRLGNLGSLVAVMLKDDAQPDFMRTKQTLPYLSTTGMPEIRDDCRHSTKSWGQAYQYAVDVLGGPVAVGSDWNGVAQHLGPRFGNQGCGGSATVLIGAFDPDDGGVGESRAHERSAQEKAGDQLQYPFTLPGFGTFDKQVTGQKTFDFNYDGLAHIGMMPDMLGDLLQIGLREEDLNPLMQSAEAYVTLWEKADFIAGLSDDLGPTAPAECVDRVVTAGPNCSAVDVSIAGNGLFGNPDVTLVQSPAGPYSLGTHQVTLVVNRDNGLTCEAADSCAATVTVSCSLTADAGPDQTIECAGDPNTTVQLNGSGSYGPDPGDSIFTYLWTGGIFTPNDEAVNPTVDVPLGVHVFGLEVFDTFGLSDTDSVQVTVEDTVDPVIVAPGDISVQHTAHPHYIADLGTPSVTEVCGFTVSNDAPAGNLFPLGMTVVTWTITDDSGRTSQDTQNVEVLNTAPDADDQSPVVVEDSLNNVITLTASDINNDSPLAFALVGGSGPSHGTLGGAAPNLTYTPDPDYFGPDEFKFTATDEHSATSAEATVSITVTPVNDPPVITISRATATVQYSDTIGTVTITATDVDDDPLTLSSEYTDNLVLPPIAGLPSDLGTAGGCVAVPNDTTSPGTSCSWDLTGQMLEDAGDYDITFTVTDGGGGEGTNESDSGATKIIVNAEDATINFDLANVVAVQVDGDGSDSSELFSLSVYIDETEPDLATFITMYGDMALAVPHMILTPVGPGGPEAPLSCDAPSVAGTGYDQVMTFTCHFEGVPVNTYSVDVSVDGGYYTGENDDVLTVFDPSLGFATGGGWFYWPGTNDKTNFGYVMKYNKKRTNLQGNLLMIRHVEGSTTGEKWRIKSNALEGLAIGSGADFSWASFSGKATYRSPTEDNEGNNEFTVYVEDHGVPGKDVDQFWVQTRDKQEDVRPDLSMPEPGAGNTETIEGGNIFVPHTSNGRGK